MPIARRFVASLLLLIASLTLALALAELFLRIAPLEQFTQLKGGSWQPHLTRGHTMSPNQDKTRWSGIHWHTNSLGFRDTEHRLSATGPRLVALGDSYLVGHEVAFEDSFLRQLGARHDIEIINLAVSGYGTIQQRIVWQELGRHYLPDLVVLGVYLGNDLSDNAAFPNKYCVIDGILTSCPSNAANPTVKTLARLAESSLLARLILRGVHRYLRNDERETLPPGSKPLSRATAATANREPAPEKQPGQTAVQALARSTQATRSSSSEDGPIIRYGRAAARLYAKQWHSTYQRGFDLMLENIQALHEDTAAHGARLVVVVIPAESQLYDWRWNAYVAEQGLNPDHYDRFRVIHLLTEFLHRQQIPAVNLLPKLRKAAIEDTDLHPGRWHWSVDANRLAAEVVGDYLATRIEFPSARDARR